MSEVTKNKKVEKETKPIDSDKEKIKDEKATEDSKKNKTSKTTTKKSSKTTGTTKTKKVEKSDNKEEIDKPSDDKASTSKTKKTTSTKSKSTTTKKTTGTTKKSTKTSTKSKASNKEAEEEKKDVVEENVELKENKTKKTSKKNTTKKTEEKDNQNTEKDNKTVKEVEEKEDKNNNDTIEDEEKNENVEIETNEDEIEDDDESKYDTVSLKEIRDAIENKVDKKQKKSIIRDVIINIGIAVLMIVYLGIIIMGSKNIDAEALDKDLKIMTLGILFCGIVLLEVSYKKDKSKIALTGVETIIFGASNLCLVYIAKLYTSQLLNVALYMGCTIAGYYIIKSIVVSILTVKRFKKDNNDIKDIVQKKVKVEE